MKRIAAIDYGMKRIGLALSDVQHIFAQPLALVTAENSLEKTGHKLFTELSTYAPFAAIVLGLPLLLNGKDSPLSLIVRDLAKILERLFLVPIVLWDERLSSIQVERVLKEAKFTRKKRTYLVDAMAASAILQNYLDSLLYQSQ